MLSNGKHWPEMVHTLPCICYCVYFLQASLALCATLVRHNSQMLHKCGNSSDGWSILFHPAMLHLHALSTLDSPPHTTPQYRLLPYIVRAEGEQGPTDLSEPVLNLAEPVLNLTSKKTLKTLKTKESFVACSGDYGGEHRHSADLTVMHYYDVGPSTHAD